MQQPSTAFSMDSMKASGPTEAKTGFEPTTPSTSILIINPKKVRIRMKRGRFLHCRIWSTGYSSMALTHGGHFQQLVTQMARNLRVKKNPN